MKVGVLTFHRAHNYGAVLQCYALQQVLKRMGHEVEIIDYRQPSVEKYYKLLRFDRLMKSLKSFSSFIYFIAIARYNYRRFIPFKHFSRFLNLSKRTHYKVEDVLFYDAVMVGSDQLLNTEITGGLDSWYAGKFILSNCKAQKIAYAISADMPSILRMNREQLVDIVNTFDSFSFRETSIAKVIENKTEIKITTCLDPTLLTEPSDWTTIVGTKKESEKYIVVYEVRKPKEPNLLIDKAKEYAKRNSLKCIEISNPFSDVSDWLSYIKYADCVFTSSFHATAFSLIFGTPLIAFRLDDGNDARYVDILQNLGIEDNIKRLTDDVYSIPNYPSNLQERIKKLREPSLNYITESLSKFNKSND